MSRGVVGTIGARVRQVRTDFLTAYHEREDLLRHELVGDVDIDDLRARRQAGDLSVQRRPAAARTPQAAPTEDASDDDGDLPYSFF